ncbi:MAG: PQQ-dependent sugar dehydrogenase [Pirellulales bacterium]
MAHVMPQLLLLLALTSAERTPWTTSRITGSPEPPPPYVAARAFDHVTLNHPVFFVYEPTSKRFFVGEQGGTIRTFSPDSKDEPVLAIDLPQEITTHDQLPAPHKFDALYALAFHPRFAENRYCYVCYTLGSADGKLQNLPDGSRISRFRVTDSTPPRLDPASEEVILTWLQGGHNGCDLQFGPDGCLYISTGDARPPSPPDDLHTGQDITDLMSSILRIDVDRRDAGKQYAIPSDNPFVATQIDGKPARGEVWAYGFRNPWRMSFDRATGQLWVGDVGWELWELVHRVEKGGNYGWSAVEGRQPIHASDPLGPTPLRTPMIELPHTLAASITGGFVYHGKRFPELAGAYIFGDWEFRRLWAARFEGDRLASLQELTRPTVRVVTFGEDADGELYFLDYDTGLIHTLERNDAGAANKQFPQRLSETGLFRSVADHTPAAGVVAYDINAPQWHDGATAERWLALPGQSGISVYPGDGKPMPSQVQWHRFRLHFPQDAVLLKTLSLELEAGRPESRRRIETQLLHFDGADWRAYSFRWRDDQSDADLVPSAGDERVLRVRDAAHPQGERTQVWQFHDRTQCLQCHSQWPQYAIGFHLSQLNRVRTGPSGATENQLVQLAQTGHLVRRSLEEQEQPPFDATLASHEERLAEPFAESSESLDKRARAYLHANCSHCHRFNGGGIVGLDLLAKQPLAATKLLEAPIRGEFGIPGAKVVAPGRPEQSTLYLRMAKFGRDRMPHIGSERPDEQGLRLISQWIRELAPSEPTPAAASGLSEQLADASRAVVAAREVADAATPAARRQEILQAATKLEPGIVRDLFEGYLPQSGEEPRLGPRPRATTILGKAGDAGRGRKLFLAQESKCISCHKLGEQGVPLGPDLAKLAGKRTREELLDSLLQPSRTIDPAFAAFQVLDHSGRSHVGLLVRRDARSLVLRDAQNKELAFAADDVERVTPSRVSLMPDGLLAPFTAQQAADLLEYLKSP